MEKKVASAFLLLFIVPAPPSSGPGIFSGPNGRIFSLCPLLLPYPTILYLSVKDPALPAERYKKPCAGGQPRRVRYAMDGIMIGFTAWIMIMPVDAKRFGWSPAFPFWVQAFGFAGLLIGPSFLFFRSSTDNPLPPLLVRVRKDRQQRVVSDGDYGVGRHPMYLGGDPDVSWRSPAARPGLERSHGRCPHRPSHGTDCGRRGDAGERAGRLSRVYTESPVPARPVSLVAGGFLPR